METSFKIVLYVIISILLFSGCAAKKTRIMEVTAYCGCGSCCGWERGSRKYLRINFWNKYYVSGSVKGKSYEGKTASGTKPRQYNPGLFSLDSIKNPWMIPVRIILFPWLLLPRHGTVAADTKYYPFGTRLNIPGYGKGIVEDRGSAIKGPERLDVFFNNHSKALNWGRQKLPVEIKRQ